MVDRYKGGGFVGENNKGGIGADGVVGWKSCKVKKSVGTSM